MSKWARMTHLDIWNTSYGQKKGRKSNWQFDSRPLKVGNRLDSLAWRWRVRSITLLQTSPPSKVCTQSYGTPKLQESQIWEISRLPLGSPGTKYTIRGKVVASSKSKLWWVLWVHVCLWFVRAPKVFQLCTNQLV
jgi:hypothetical protein